MFVPTEKDSGKLSYQLAAGSITFVKGNALKNSSGYLTNTASGDNTDVKYVCMENKVTGATDGESLLVIEITGVKFIADSSNTPTQAQMKTQIDLSAAGTVDSSATTDQVFYAEKLVGPASAKKIMGYFTGGAPNA